MPGLPTEPGAYYKDPSKGWVTLERTPAPQIRTKGGKTLGVNPFAKLHSMASYRGADGHVRISEPSPTFYLRQIGSPRDAVIVKPDKKKDRREISVSQVGGFGGVTSGYEEKARREVSVTQVSNGLLSVTPKSSIDPGEYLPDTGSGTYDFGIDTPK
jgi:hypothetical protein